LVIILFLAKAEDEAVVFAVIVSTIVTTVCGMWLAYGETAELDHEGEPSSASDQRIFLRLLFACGHRQLPNCLLECEKAA